MKSTILYEDREIIVLKKPAGIATQTARAGQQDVAGELKNYLACGRKDGGYGTAPYVGVVHRLDQPVEGVLVFGKTSRATASLNGQLRDGALVKRYCAALCGTLPGEEGRLEDYLRKDAGLCMALPCGPSHPKAKKAVLEYRVRDCRRIEAGAFTAALNEPAAHEIPLTLAEVSPLTGRFHQIRAQMARAGCPLLGDRKYGDENAKQISEALHIENVALCAYALAFTHPVSGKKMEYTVSPENRAFTVFPNFLE